MPFHNPFIKDGRITFPEGASVVKHVERWAGVTVEPRRGDASARRYRRKAPDRNGPRAPLRRAQPGNPGRAWL